jgi:hypothetical protein
VLKRLGPLSPKVLRKRRQAGDLPMPVNPVTR